MSIQVTEAKRRVRQEVPVVPPPAPPLRAAMASEEPERLAAARGIAVAVVISAPFWFLAGFTAYMLF